jgi:NADH-quinone oxidoreductase subunit G
VSAAPEMVTVTVDGREIQVPKGTGMIETALAAGIEIPVFCYEPRLGPPVGACRMCLCEVEGMPKLQAACTLTAQDGLALHTAQTSAKAAEGQQAVLEFILLNHPLDCPDCDKGGECPLQDLTFRWGPSSTRMHFPKRTFDKPIPISPVITLDRERCILCYRCTRYSEAVSEDMQLVARNRGAHSIIATFENEPYRAHFSGNVTELCPVGALLPATYRFRARPWEVDNVPTVCGLCPVGCNTWAQTREGNVVRILSRNHPEVDDGWLCDKGRFAFDHLRADDRITQPLVRVRRRGFERADLGRAVDAAVEGLRQAGDSIAVAFSGGETVEQAEAISRLVQALGGETALLPDDLDPAVDGFRAPLAAIRDAEVCLVLGDDPVVERAPLVDLWLRAARRNGAEIVTVSPVGSAQVAPGSAPTVADALTRGDRPEALGEASDRLRNAGRVAIVWSGDDHDGGRRAVALASALRLGEGSGLYVLPRTPNGRGVAQAWRNAGGGDPAEPTDEGELGALIISGDEAAYDPRVTELARRARFVLTTAMFMGPHTLAAHLVVPGTSYLERDGTTVNLEGRPQRQRRAVDPSFPVELEFFAQVGARLAVPISPWPTNELPPERAHLPERAAPSSAPTPAPVTQANDDGPGLQLVTYRSAFSGPAVERVEALAFLRPALEVELSAPDAGERGIANGDVVAVSSNGTSRELRAKINRRLRPGIVRIADEVATDLHDHVEVAKA